MRGRSRKELERTARVAPSGANTQGTDFLTGDGAEDRRARPPRSSTCERVHKETHAGLLAAACLSWQGSEQWEQLVSK